MRAMLLAAVLSLYVSQSASAQIGVYTGVLPFTQNNIPVVLGKIPTAAGYSGKTPYAYFGPGLLTASAGAIQESSPGIIRYYVSVSYQEGAISAVYECAGSLGSDLSMTLVRGHALFPGSITLTHGTAGTLPSF